MPTVAKWVITGSIIGGVIGGIIGLFGEINKKLDKINITVEEIKTQLSK